MAAELPSETLFRHLKEVPALPFFIPPRTPREKQATETGPAAPLTDKSTEALDDNLLFHYFLAGYKPYTRKTPSGTYIQMRKTTVPRHDVNIGKYSDERWEELEEIYQNWQKEHPLESRDEEEAARMEEELANASFSGLIKPPLKETPLTPLTPLTKVKRTRGEGAGLLTAPLAKPSAIAKSIGLDIATIQWYQMFVEHGYDKSIGEWINEIVDGFMMVNDMKLAVIVTREG